MIPVIAGETIPVNGDMAKKELQIETESKLGSEDLVYIRLTSGTSLYGNIQIFFRAKMEYHIGFCTPGYENAFDREPTITVPSIWRIRVISKTSVQVWCNDELVLTYLFKNAGNPNCLSYNPQTITGFVFVKPTDAEAVQMAAQFFKIVDITGENHSILGPFKAKPMLNQNLLISLNNYSVFTRRSNVTKRRIMVCSLSHDDSACVVQTDRRKFQI